MNVIEDFTLFMYCKHPLIGLMLVWYCLVIHASLIAMGLYIGTKVGERLFS